MRIRELYDRQKLTLSFEFFPPKTTEAEEVLFQETVPALKKLGPSFVSVTYGAGGGTKDTTLRVVHRVRKEFGIEAMAHLTCVGSTKAMLSAVLDEAKSLGIENILALRGDPPRGQLAFEATAGGFTRAAELIRHVRSFDCFGIGAACYPEGHVESQPHREQDWDHTAAKVEAGAEFLITQLFYDWDDFLAMEDYLRNRRGVKVPIVPGVLPFLGTAQIRRFTSLCGSKLSPELEAKLDRFAEDDEAVRKLGVEVCTEICRKAVAHGVKGIHFYCLNRVPSVREILENLGLAPRS